MSLAHARPECMASRSQLHRARAVGAGPGEDRVDRLHLFLAAAVGVGRHDHLGEDLPAEDDVAALGVVGRMRSRPSPSAEVLHLQRRRQLAHRSPLVPRTAARYRRPPSGYKGRMTQREGTEVATEWSARDRGRTHRPQRGRAAPGAAGRRTRHPGPVRLPARDAVHQPLLDARSGAAPAVRRRPAARRAADRTATAPVAYHRSCSVDTRSTTCCGSPNTVGARRVW